MGIETPTALPSLLGGFEQGYGFANAINQQHLQNQRAQERDQRERQLLNLREQGIQMQNQRLEQNQRQKDAERYGNALQYEMDHGGIQPETLKGFSKATGLDMNHFLSPQNGQALQTAHGVFTGQADVNSPQAIQSANTIYADQLHKNIGEKLPDGSVITGKKINKVVPGPGGKTVAFDLQVQARKADGTPYTYNAPMTDGRNTDGEVNVMQVPVEKLAQDVAGRTHLYKALDTPQARQQIQAALIENGINPPQQGIKSTFEIKHGNNIITYAQMMDGSTKELSSAPRWQPKKSGSGSKGSAPAEVQTIQWLSDNITNGDKKRAFRLYQQGKRNPRKMAATLYSQFLKQNEQAVPSQKLTTAQIQDKVHEVMNYLSTDPYLNPGIDPNSQQAQDANQSNAPQGQPQSTVQPAQSGASQGTGQSAEIPPISALNEGVKTTFRNGQVWTLQNGNPVQISASPQSGDVKKNTITSATDSPVVDQAVSQYPILSKFNLKGVESPGAQPYKLEFWGKNNPGDSKEPRPQAIPTGSIGVQIFDKNTRPIDVLADVASHYMRFNDPTMKHYYQQFLDSITPAQEKRLHGDYQYAKTHGSVQRPFDQWVQDVRLPAYFRGYTFKQWPNSFNMKVFTPVQIKLFNQVRQYLGVK